MNKPIINKWVHLKAYIQDNFAEEDYSLPPNKYILKVLKQEPDTAENFYQTFTGNYFAPTKTFKKISEKYTFKEQLSTLMLWLKTATAEVDKNYWEGINSLTPNSSLQEILSKCRWS